MGINPGEWTSIRGMIDRVVSNRAEPFVTCKVTKSDPKQEVVFTKEFGVQPIPVVAFSIEVTYYDTVWNPGTSSNRVEKKNAKVSMGIPGPGDTVLIAREMGTARLPRCLGVLRGGNWIITGDDD